MIALLDGRDELIGEIRAAPVELRAFVAERLRDIRHDPRLLDVLYGWLPPDATSQARAPEVLVPRIDELIASG